MRWSLKCIALIALAGDAVSNVAAADCICRARGQQFELGQSVCLPTAKGPRIATCGMVLNNTSWQFSDTPCVVSAAPVRQPVTARHDHQGS